MNHYKQYKQILSGGNGYVFFVDLRNQNWSISTFKKPVPDEKDTTIESDSTQKMMSWWNWTESGMSSTDPEVETPQSTPNRKKIREKSINLI